MSALPAFAEAAIRWVEVNTSERIRELLEVWTCDMCGRRIWLPLLRRHELRHTDEEWAAAGYDKAGTLAGPPDQHLAKHDE